MSNDLCLLSHKQPEYHSQDRFELAGSSQGLVVRDLILLQCSLGLLHVKLVLHLNGLGNRGIVKQHALAMVVY